MRVFLLFPTRLSQPANDTMKVGSSSGGAHTNGSDSYTDGSHSGGAHSKMQHLDSSFDGPSASNNGKPATDAAAADHVSLIILCLSSYIWAWGFRVKRAVHTECVPVFVCVLDGSRANMNLNRHVRVPAHTHLRFSMKMCMHIECQRAAVQWRSASTPQRTHTINGNILYGWCASSDLTLNNDLQLLNYV